ncbi:VanZ family protein [Aurantivibrio plasticivorans]
MKTVAKFKLLWCWLAWLQFVSLLSLITYLSLKPDHGDIFVSIWDKALHVFGWFVIGGSLSAAWGYRRHYLTAIVALWCYSVFIEIMQQLTGRQLSGFDMLANAIGCSLACGLFLLLKSLWPSWFFQFLTSKNK